MTITKNKKRFSKKPDRAISTSRDFTLIYNERGNAQEKDYLGIYYISENLFNFVKIIFENVQKS